MTYSPDDVPDWVADRCEELHTEPRTDCAYCPTRADLKICGYCEEEIYPHETCPNCPPDLPALVVDGFGSALVTPLQSGVGA